MHDPLGWRPHRPPPLDAPVEAVVRRGDALAQRWLVALLASRPLKQAGAVPIAQLAAQGPELCAAIVRALVSDEELERLRGDRDLAALARRAGRIAGAADAAGTVDAVELLRRVIWEAIDQQLPEALGGDGTAMLAQRGALADRLAHVCAIVTAESTSAAPAVEREPDVAPRTDEMPRIHVAPGEETPLWIAALERYLAEGRRCSLMLIELDGAERLRASEPAGTIDAAFGRASRAIRAQVRRGDLIAHEENGRAWVISPDLGRAGANALAERIAAAIERAASLRAVPLAASVGIAVHPEDGRDVDSLMSRAEEAMFAARAEGARVAGRGATSAPPGPGDGGFGPGPRIVG
jgi:GGDEF domain-containing protein